MASSCRAFFKSAHASDTCSATVPSRQMPGDHPVRPSFTKPQISDSTSYPRHSPITVQAAFRRAPRVRAACPPPGGSPATSSGHPAGRTRFRRQCSSAAPRTATAHSNPRFVSGGQPAIMSHRAAASLKASPDGVSGRAPVPQARPHSCEDLPTGQLRRRRRRRCKWRAGPGCRATVVAESGIRTLRIPSPHRGGSHGPRPGHGGRQSAASRCTLETGEERDGRQPHRRRGTARRYAADLG